MTSRASNELGDKNIPGFILSQVFGVYPKFLAPLSKRHAKRMTPLMCMQNTSKALRNRLLRFRKRLALWLEPSCHSRTSSPLLPGQEFKLMTLAPLDSEALAKGIVKVRYCAFDPIWRDTRSAPEDMITLREHVTRLWSVAHELADQSSSKEWGTITENLRLAASLNDLSANTDIDGHAQWCGLAAEYETMNSEVASKYVASVITFNFVWAAYEAAVEVACSATERQRHFGRGARGREVLLRIMGGRHFPHLRHSAFSAFELNNTPTIDFASSEMRRLMAENSIAGVAAEFLRCFRNAVAHGAIAPPMPRDWGERSSYTPDDDPAISQFHHIIRTTLLLTQILIRSTLNSNDELSGWLSGMQSGTLLLTQLHCELPETVGCELPFVDTHLIDSSE